MTSSVPSDSSGLAQGRPIAIDTGTATGQPQVYFQAVTALPSPPSKEIRFRKVHRSLGITQIIIGSICLGNGIIGIFFNGLDSRVGIWTGLFFILPGLLGLHAARKNSRCLLVACKVTNIIGTVVAVLGAYFAVMELYSYSTVYMLVMAPINIALCVVEFVMSIIHASLTCASSCAFFPYGEYRQSTSQTTNVPVAVVFQQPGQMVDLNAAVMHTQYQSVANPAFDGNAGANTSTAPLPVMPHPSAVEGADTSCQNRNSPPPSYSETVKDSC